MRIVVNDIAASEGGAMSVLKDLYTDILENHNNIEWIFLLGDKYVAETANIKVLSFPEIKNSWLKRINFDLYSGSELVNTLKPDIYISLQNTATLHVDAKQYVYFHQVIPYQTTMKFSPLKKSEFILWVYQNIGKLMYNFLFRKSNASVIVQSEWLKRRMKIFLANNILVVKPTVSLESKVPKNTQSNKVTQFFYPTSDNEYKNLKVIFAAADILKKRNLTTFKIILTIDKKNKIDNKSISFTGKISRQEVYSYLTNSTLVFPSLLESFGLPLLEAKAMGAYIIAADLEYAHETLDTYDNVDYFSPNDAKALADSMEQVIRGNNGKHILIRENNKYKKETIDAILEDYNE